MHNTGDPANTNTEIRKYKYTNTIIGVASECVQYKYTNTNTQKQIHKYKYTNTNTSLLTTHPGSRLGLSG